MPGGFIWVGSESDDPRGKVKTFGVAAAHATRLSPGDAVVITSTSDANGLPLVDAAAAGAYAQNAAAFQPVVIGATADTIDLLIATATTAPTAGVARVWAVLMNVDGRIAADEVDRDQLA